MFLSNKALATFMNVDDGNFYECKGISIFRGIDWISQKCIHIFQRDKIWHKVLTKTYIWRESPTLVWIQINISNGLNFYVLYHLSLAERLTGRWRQSEKHIFKSLSQNIQSNNFSRKLSRNNCTLFQRISEAAVHRSSMEKLFIGKHQRRSVLFIKLQLPPIFIFTDFYKSSISFLF